MRLRLWMLTALALALGGCGSVPEAGCAITPPNGSLPPGEQAASPDYLGSDGLWTVLWPEGRVIFEPGGAGEIRSDGSLAMKFPFWRGEGVVGPLTVSGVRLDGDSSSMTAEIPDGYGLTGFQATALVFPSAGCWEVTAAVGEHRLTFITQVVVSAGSGG